MEKEYSFLQEMDIKTGIQAMRRSGASKQQIVDVLNSGGRLLRNVDGINITPRAAPTVWGKMMGFLTNGSTRRLRGKTTADQATLRQALSDVGQATGELTRSTKKATKVMKKSAQKANPFLTASDTASGLRKQAKAARKAAEAASEGTRQLQTQIGETIGKLEAIKGSIPKNGRIDATNRTNIIDKLLAVLRDPAATPVDKEVALARAHKIAAKYNASVAASAVDAAAVSQPTALRGAVAKSQRALERTATRTEPQYLSGELKARALEEPSKWDKVLRFLGLRNG